MHRDRIHPLNEEPLDEDALYVLYWMQQSQRAEFNPTLEYAIRRANELGKGVIVGFGLTDAYPEANERHYAFMLEGLGDVSARLRERGIKLVARKGSPEKVAADLARDAALVVCDRGYLRHQRAWRAHVAEAAGRMVVEIEGDAVVPVETASGKAEYAARTLRPKLKRAFPDFTGEIAPSEVKVKSLWLAVTGDLDLDDPDGTLADLDIDRSVGRVTRFSGGTGAARERLDRFLEGVLDGYAEARNDPSDPACSNLSPYLHFGQISPVEIVRKINALENVARADRDSFIDELVVRRELSINHVWFTENYDDYDCLPDWAKKTLFEHESDDRPSRYGPDALVACDTHDRYWNAAMREMVQTGYMHNYMRMYWGKKILEWSATPAAAFKTTLDLNNRYFLDGRDPNSFACVAWIFGLHDRPWAERAIYGKVRTMTSGGLERKFDIDAYVRWTERL